MAYPCKAEFLLSPYDDGSGHRVRVAYNVKDEAPWRGEIRIGEDYGISFPIRDAQAVIDAIRFCASAIDLNLDEEPTA